MVFAQPQAKVVPELVFTPAMAATPLPPLMASRATPAWRAAKCPYLQMEGLAGGGTAVGSQGRRRTVLGEEGGRSAGREADGLRGGRRPERGEEGSRSAGRKTAGVREERQMECGVGKRLARKEEGDRSAGRKAT